MKIYTRTGDDGSTALFAGGRVSKASLRVEAYGSVDELNSQLGLVRAMSPDSELDLLLDELQNDLFVVGADLATPHRGRGDQRHTQRLREQRAARLEELIDHLQDGLPPLLHFILPGGTAAAAQLHLARTVCRRAERRVIALIEAGEKIGDDVLIYLNRLSDLLFVMARYANHRVGGAETQWKGTEAE